MSTAGSPVPVFQGQVLAGKYRVDRVLGAGGMGVVVAATHIELGQHVAIKFLLPAAVNVPDARERFIREARAAATLRSDHVARVVDVGSLEDGAPYMIMEFLDGCDLGQLLVKSGPLRTEDAVGFVLQACEAVAEAHASGIVHRDLKPGNLFLTRKPSGAPHIKVLDFGISKSTRVGSENFSLTKTSDVIGSPIYMAPEQIRSARDVDERTDIWALGVILYELLTGKVPFPAQNVPQLCSMVLEKEPAPISSLRPDIPFELTQTVMRCLQKDPANRFGCIADLARSLLPFQPAPAASGLTRTESPVPPLHSSVASSADRPSQVLGETLLGPHPTVPTARGASAGPSAVDPSTMPRVYSRGPQTDTNVASVTSSARAASESKRSAPVAVLLVIALTLLGVGLAGTALWTLRSRSGATMEPLSSSVPVQSSSIVPELASASASPMTTPSASAPIASASASTGPDVTPSPPRTTPRGTGAAPTRTSTADTTSPPATTRTAPPATGDSLPNERK